MKIPLQMKHFTNDFVGADSNAYTDEEGFQGRRLNFSQKQRQGVATTNDSMATARQSERESRRRELQKELKDLEDNKSEDDIEEQQRLYDQLSKKKVEREYGRKTGAGLVESNSVKKVHAADIMRNFRSKEDFIKILSIEGQFYLPPVQECTVDFLRDVCAGRKGLLQNDEVRVIYVPRMPELSAKHLLKEAIEDEDINYYLPPVRDNHVLNKEFLFNIINTVKPEFFPESIRDLMRIKQEKIAMSRQKFVYMTERIYTLVQNTQIIPQSK